MDDEEFRGGVNTVRRTGDVVRRPAGPWTPAVHALLAHVTAAGFAGAPRPHGFDADGREVVDFIPGEVGHYPLPGYVRSDATIEAVGRLLRAYHDATVDFTPPPGATWFLPPRAPAEVICHGDVAPYNCVFRDGRPVAFIDFDTVHPGPRVWDLAYAAYRFVPLAAASNPDSYGTVADQARRLRLLCDAYGVDGADRSRLVPAVLDRLEAVIDLIRTRAAAGDEAFAAHLAGGHVELYLTDIAHIRANFS
ncbi:aminoglycoside phosphotransferase family protein [Actinomycetes bacterium KLBMP 9797]